MPDTTALRRQWMLIQTLSARRNGVSLGEMARDMGVTEKTIRRDLDLFRSLGFPIEELVEEFGRKRWSLRNFANQPHLAFTFEEAIAICMGRRFLEPLAGTIFWNAAQAAFRKLRASFDERALAHLQKFQCFFHQTSLGTSDYSKRADLIDTLMLSMEESRAVHILYQSQRATEPAFRDVYPYGLVYHQGSLYLVALDPQEDKLKHYKVDRIEQVETSRFPFQRQPNFDLERHLASSFGIYHGDGNVNVTIRFMPPVVRYVSESSWHPSQHLTPQRDGSLLARFSLSGCEEIKTWVLSFGANAEVLEPLELRREIRDELERMVARYRSNEARGEDTMAVAELRGSVLVEHRASRR